MTARTTTSVLAIVLAIVAIGGIAVAGVTVAQESTGDDTTDPQQSSHLRVVHATADAPAVNVTLDDETVLENVEYGNVSDYLEVTAGNHTVAISAAEDPDTVVFEGTIYLEPRTSSTLVASTDVNQGEMVEDDPADGTETDTDTADDGMEETETAGDGLEGTDTPEDGLDETETAVDGLEETETTEGDMEETETAGDGLEETETTEGDVEATETAVDGLEETDTPEDGMAETETAADGGMEGTETDTESHEANGEDSSLQMQPLLFNDDALEPADNESALSVMHLAPDAPAVDVTVAENDTEETDTPTEMETDTPADNSTTTEEHETMTPADNATTTEDQETMTPENETMDSEPLVVAENLSYQDASDYLTVPAGDHTLEIRAAAPDNDGEVLTTVDVTVEGGVAYSALALEADDGGDAGLTFEQPEDATYTLNLPGTNESS